MVESVKVHRQVLPYRGRHSRTDSVIHSHFREESRKRGRREWRSVRWKKNKRQESRERGGERAEQRKTWTREEVEECVREGRV